MSPQNVIYSGVQAYFAFRSYEYLRAFNEARFGTNEFKVNENWMPFAQKIICH